MTGTSALELVTHGDREVLLTRALDAPREAVFDALTRPDLLRRWLLGPPGWSMDACDVELAVGGTFRFAWRREADGAEMGMCGAYREVAPPGRLVHTETFDAAPHLGETVVTTTLAEQDGGTALTARLLYASREARDAMLGAGMEHGVRASHDRLAELLAGAS